MKYDRTCVSACLLLLTLGVGIVLADAPDSTVILERNGKRYMVDTAAMTVQEIGPTKGDDTPALFQQNCARCHGPNGKGVASVHTLDFTNPTLQRSLRGQDITNAIRNGKDGDRMPAWSGKLTDAQIDPVNP